MEPLACSNQPLGLDGSESEDGIQLHSRLSSAADRLPKFVKAESVKNQLRKSPHGVSEEEMEFTLPDSSLPKTGVVPREKVKNLIDQNGIKLERKVMGGASREGSIAKAAREKYLALEKRHQEAKSALRDWENSPEGKEHSKLDKIQFFYPNTFTPESSARHDSLSDVRAPLSRSEIKLSKAKQDAYAEMNATAGKPDELIQAEKNYKAALDRFGVLRKKEVVTDPNSPLSLEFTEAATARQEAKKALEYLKRKHENSTPRYGEYTTPEGIPGSYQEHLLKVPRGYASDRSTLEAAAQKEWGKGYSELTPPQQAGVRTISGSQDYNSPHWPEDPNVIAHWRADDRVGPNGEKVLHVHEVQSDWHQKGRDIGYGEEPVTDDHIRNFLSHQYGTPYSNVDPEKIPQTAVDRVRNNPLKSNESDPSLVDLEFDRPPHGPFKNNEWANLALKDIMDHALKNGYDAVTFNDGELAKMYAAGGGGDIGGLKDWYERQIPARMQKLFGLKNEPHTMAVKHEAAEFGEPDDSYRAGGVGNHVVPFFRLRHDGKLLGNLEKAKQHGMFLMSNQRKK